MRLSNWLIIGCVGVFFSCGPSPSEDEIAEKVSAILEEQVNDSTLIEAYRENNFLPIWVKRGGLKPNGEKYLEELDDLVYDGLEKQDYWPEEMTQHVAQAQKAKDPLELAQLDLEISRSFLALASDLHIGKIDPNLLDIDWKLKRKTPTVDYAELLNSIAAGESLADVFTQLRPQHDEYNKLREQLKEILENPEKASTSPISFEGKIEKGSRNAAIPTIRQKMAAWKGESISDSSDVYSDNLFAFVTEFQRSHGLIDDGVLGSDFIEAANYLQSDLVNKIKVNLERWRWLPDFSGKDDRVIVNIPDYYLFYVENGDTVLISKVVVGKDYRQTPIFKSTMSYLVFSPTWTLPETILWEDVIPSVRKNLGYLASHNMQVLDMDGNAVNPRGINWNKLEGKEDFPYMIRQSPGKENPLGQVKFMFPNDYSIYIHDSPAQHLFNSDERTFSSGCIRMEKPVEFAQLLLEGAGDWEMENIEASMNETEEQNVSLKKNPEVWILYVSTWVKNGQLEVRKDIYEMDRRLAKAMSLPVSEHFL